MYKCVSKGSCTPNLQFCFVCFRPCVSFWLLPPPCSGTVSSYLMFAGIKWPYCQSLFTALFLTFTARSPVRSLTLEGGKMTSQSSLRIVFFVVSYFGTTVSFISALDKYISAKKQAQRIKRNKMLVRSCFFSKACEVFSTLLLVIQCGASSLFVGLL